LGREYRLRGLSTGGSEGDVHGPETVTRRRRGILSDDFEATFILEVLVFVIMIDGLQLAGSVVMRADETVV
jgi:hypothetical protein